MGRTRDARRVIKVPAVWAGRHARIEGGWFDRILWAGKHAGHIHRRSQSGSPVFETRSSAWMPPSVRHPFRRLKSHWSTPKIPGILIREFPRGACTSTYLVRDSVALGVEQDDDAVLDLQLLLMGDPMCITQRGKSHRSGRNRLVSRARGTE